MAIKLNNKKMANIGLIMVLVGAIIVALGGFIWNKYSGKVNNEKHLQLLDQGNSIKDNVKEAKDQTSKGINELKEHITTEVKRQVVKSEIILVSPGKILIPANASRDVSVVITNNHDYPVFSVSLELKVIDGELDLSTNFLLLPLCGAGVRQSKYYSCAIPQINARASVNFIARVDGYKYSKSSKIKLSVLSYMKEPAEDFTMQGMRELPQTIKFPDGFVSKIYPNK